MRPQNTVLISIRKALFKERPFVTYSNFQADSKQAVFLRREDPLGSARDDRLKVGNPVVSISCSTRRVRGSRLRRKQHI